MIVNKDNKRYKHLTQDDRNILEIMLQNAATFQTIAAALGKDACTISREVRKHRTLVANRFTNYDEQNNVINESCPKLEKPPYVCNACKKRHSCRLKRYLYVSRKAHEQYRNMLRDSREGIPLNKAEFYDMDAKLSAAIRSGQHMYQALQSTGVEIAVSTAYKYADKGYFSFTSLDLHRKVKFKSRKKKRMPYVPPAVKKGRTYADFLQYIETHEITNWVEMDTVIGRPGGKVILTLLFTICNFMVGILLDSKSALAVSQEFRHLREKFAAAQTPFDQLFPLILTDNGGEFANIHSIECNAAGTRETHLFFCDAMKSCQKPRVEKNHTLFRDILPKGSSFDALTQDTADIIFSHVNSVKRKQFNGKSPFELFAFAFGQDAPKVLGISFVEPDQVVQSPRLLSLIQAGKA